MAEPAPLALEARNVPVVVEQENQTEVTAEKGDTIQTSILSDSKSFIDKISSFFNHQALSDVVIQVVGCIFISSAIGCLYNYKLLPLVVCITINIPCIQQHALL